MLQSQATASRTALLSPERAQRQERAGRLAETRSHHDLLARRLGEAEAALDGQRPALIEQDALRFEQSAALEREAQQPARRDAAIAGASWTRPARKAWANGCPRPRPIASGCNVAATSWIGARRRWTCCCGC